MAVDDAQRLFVIENARPCDQLAGGRRREWRAKVRELPLVLPPEPQDRKTPPHRGQRRQPAIRGRVGVEAVAARGTEGTEAGQVAIARGSDGPEARPSLFARVLRTEHRLAQEHVGAGVVGEIGQEGLAHRSLRTRERLLAAVVDARDAQREELQRHARDHLVLRRRIGREAKLVTRHVIVIVQHRHVPGAELAVRAQIVGAHAHEIEIRGGTLQPLGDGVQHAAHVADVERGIQVEADHAPVLRGIGIRARHLAEQEEIGLAQVGGKLLDRAAEVAAGLGRHVLQRIEPEPVAVGERDPVLVAARQVRQRVAAVEVEVAKVEEVGAAKRRVLVVEVAAKVHAAGARVALVALQLRRPHARVHLRVGKGRRRAAVTVEPDALGVERGEPDVRLLARAVGVKPVAARMVEHHVEDDPQPLRVRGADQRHQILAAAEARVHVEKVLDRVAVKRVEVPALLQHRSYPQRGDAEIGEVVELRLDPLDGAALEAIVPASRPMVEAEPGGAGTGRTGRVHRRPRRLAPVAEAIRQQKVDDFVAPVARGRKELFAARKVDLSNPRGPRTAEDEVAKRHGCPPSRSRGLKGR